MSIEAIAILVIIGAIFFLIGLVAKDGMEITFLRIPPLDLVTRGVLVCLGGILLTVSAYQVIVRGPAESPSAPTPVAANPTITTPPSTPTAVTTPTVATIPPTTLPSVEPPTATSMIVVDPAPTTPLPTSIPTFGPADLVIAVPVPLSGEQAGRGQAIVNSVQLALEDYAARLDAAGLSVKLLPFDDRSDTGQGALNAQAIISNPQVRCVVGHNRSDVLGAAMPFYNTAPDKVAVISVGATAVERTTVDNSSLVLFRMVGRDDVQALVAADYIGTALGAAAKRVLVVYDESDYGRGLRDALDTALDKYSEVTIIGTRGHKGTPGDEQAIVNRVLGDEPDLVFFAAYYNQAGPIIRQIVEQRNAQGKAPPIFFGTDGLDNPEIVDLLGAARPNAFYYTTVAMPRPEYDQIQSEVDDAYVDRFGQAVPAFLAESYDGASLCLSALIEAKANPARAEVLRLIQRYSQGLAFIGISGRYTFTPQGDPRQAFYYVRQVSPTVIKATWAENAVLKKIEAAPPATP